MADSKANIIISAVDKTAAAFAAAKANVASLQSQVSASGEKLGTLGAAIGAALAGASLKQTVDALDGLDDLAEKSGVSVKALSELRYAGEVTGTSFESLGTGFKKLAQQIAAALGGDKDASRMFTAMGISMKQLKESSPDQVLASISEYFSKYADGATKAARAQEIFGKAGEEMIPLLNLGAKGLADMAQEARDLGAVYDAETAKAMADFNDNLARLEKAAEAGKVALLEQMIPAVNSFTEALITSRKEHTSFLLELAKGFDEGLISRFQITINSWKARLSSSELEDTVKGIERVTEALKKNPDNGALKIQLDAYRKRYDELQKSAADASQALKVAAMVADNSSTKPKGDDKGNGAGSGKPQMGVTDRSGKADRGDQQYQSLLEQIHERIALSNAEAAADDKLSEADKFQASMLGRLADGRLEINKQQRTYLTQLTEEAAAQMRALERDAEARKLTQESIRQLAQEAAALDDVNRTWREQAEEIGLTTNELEQLNIQRVQAAIARKQESLAAMELFSANSAELEQTRQLIEQMQEQVKLRQQSYAKRTGLEEDPTQGALAGIKDYTESLRKAGDASRQFTSSSLKSIEDALTDTFSGKKVDVKSLVDTMIAEFTRLKIVRPMLESLFPTKGASGDSGGSFDITKFISGLFGGGRADGGPVSAGKMYEVNERGIPELASVGGRDFLMMGSQGGTVTPLSTASSGVTMGVTNYIGSNLSRQEVALGITQAMAQSKADMLMTLRKMGVV